MRRARLDTPIGPVAVEVDDHGVRAVDLWPGDAEPAGDAVPAGAAAGALAVALGQLRAYFAGERIDFDVPLSVPEGQGSAFERAVWAELRRIPYGQMRTYGEIAAAVGDSGAARAVGTACHRNPIPLIVPCHRVVGAGGKLVGFGGGLPRKRWLLEHEARVSMERAWS